MTAQPPDDADQQPTRLVGEKQAPKPPAPAAATVVLTGQGAAASGGNESSADDAPTRVVASPPDLRGASSEPPAGSDHADNVPTLILDQAHAPTVNLAAADAGAPPSPVSAQTRVLPTRQAPDAATRVVEGSVTGIDSPPSLPSMRLSAAEPAATAVSMHAAPIVQIPGPRTGASASPSAARTAGSAIGRTELPEVGEVIKERFELVEELGRGGMGAVFRARDLRKVEALDPDPYVAIKFISGALIGFDRAFVALQREAKNAQSLNHPNIVKVFDFDRDDALVYLTMEVVHGESLHKRLRDLGRQPLDAAERKRLAQGMLAGMGYAHGRDISHADLKPSNMMIDGEGELKILDFGIARRREYDTVFDADDLFALTIDYASPEMLAQQRPTPADDVYALGCIIYALHAGKHPFAHVRADQACADQMRPARPAGITRVQWHALRKSLAFTREKRFVDAAHFLRAYSGRDARKVATISAVAVVLAVLLGWAIATPVQSWMTVSALPIEQRELLQRNLRDGTEYLAGGYAEDAVFAFAEALAIDSHNGTARRGVRTAYERMRDTLSAEEYRGFIALQAEDAKNPAWVQALAARELKALDAR